MTEVLSTMTWSQIGVSLLVDVTRPCTSLYCGHVVIVSLIPRPFQPPVFFFRKSANDQNWNKANIYSDNIMLRVSGTRIEFSPCTQQSTSNRVLMRNIVCLHRNFNCFWFSFSLFHLRVNLSKPYTSVTALHTCCLFACLFVWTIHLP